jgi:ferredoxin
VPAGLADRVCAACAVCAAVCGSLALMFARPGLADIFRIPGTQVAGVLLAVGVVLLLAPANWRGIPPPTRRGRLVALVRKLFHRFGAALAGVSALAAIRAAAPSPLAVPLAVATLIFTAIACVRSRDARFGFLAGLLIGLA